jgi:hypothetical protein
MISSISLVLELLQPLSLTMNGIFSYNIHKLKNGIIKKPSPLGHHQKALFSLVPSMGQIYIVA